MIVKNPGVARNCDFCFAPDPDWLRKRLGYSFCNFPIMEVYVPSDQRQGPYGARIIRFGS